MHTKRPILMSQNFKRIEKHIFEALEFKAEILTGVIKIKIPKVSTVFR